MRLGRLSGWILQRDGSTELGPDGLKSDNNNTTKKRTIERREINNQAKRMYVYRYITSQIPLQLTISG